MSAPPTALGAIVVAFDASSAKALTADGTGVWMGKIPDQLSDQDLPFVALFHDGEQVSTYEFEAAYIETTRFHFEAYDTLAAVESMALRIKAIYDKPDTTRAADAFPVLGCGCMRCWRPEGENCYTVQPTTARTSDGKIIFMATIRFRMDIVRGL